MPATRRPTIIDVARAAGVSKTTVSRIITGDGRPVQEKTRQRVLAAIETLGYQHNAVAGSLRTNRTLLAILMFPTVVDPSAPKIARGIQDELRTGDYLSVVANTDWDPQIERETLIRARRSRFDGIIINPVAVTADDLARVQIPTVILGRSDDGWLCDQVSNDYLGGVALALQHLVDLGHERIGLISGATGGAAHANQRALYRGFMRRRGLPLDEALIVECPYGQEFGAQGLRQLLGLARPPTAVLASNDVTAVGALQAAREAGLRVPEQLSIIGHGDFDIAALTQPPLTTVAREAYRLGQQAAAFLLDRIRGGGPAEPRRYIFPCNLVVRDSTAPPP